MVISLESPYPSIFVQVVDFHPNCNYIATASADRTVRIWDILSGNTVRLFTGHKVRFPSVILLSCIRTACCSYLLMDDVGLVLYECIWRRVGYPAMVFMRVFFYG